MSDDESPRSDPHSSVPAVLQPWQKKPRFSWTPAYETTFFQSLCQSVHLGLRENQSFKPEAWNRALAVLREQGAYPTKPHLINKTDNARKKFRLFRGLVENPQFTYNPATRTITASDDAWQAHLEKEPLARAFRDRPFENAEYLEILFPDVVGSGGQPKRITRPRRKGPDILPGGEAPPGTSVMRLPNNGRIAGNMAPPINLSPVPIPPNAQNAPGRQQSMQAGPNGVQIRPAPGNAAGASTIQPPPPPGPTRQLSGAASRANVANSGSALAATEESTQTGQKRFVPSGDGSGAAAPTTSKRRRTESSIAAGSGSAAAHRNRSESHAGTTTAGGNASVSAAAAATGASQGLEAAIALNAGTAAIGQGGRAGGGGNMSMAASRVDGIAGLLSDVLTKYATATTIASTTRWPEQAMEIFFQEFADEDMDLQLRIAEKILTDSSKAVMFCKMPAVLRRHWVKRLREVSSRLGN